MELRGDNITFSYDGKKNILSNVNISLESGEILGVSGMSGGGKSTLGKILAGYIKPTEGEVTIDGKAITTKDKGFCPVQLILQHPEKSVNPKFTMEKVLKEATEIDGDVLEALAIEGAWLKRVSIELSAGELQRFCVARALAKDTKFIIADEITTMLDAISQANLWEFMIKETQKRGIGLIVISHNISLLDRVCHRQVLLKNQTI